MTTTSRKFQRIAATFALAAFAGACAKAPPPPPAEPAPAPAPEPEAKAPERVYPDPPPPGEPKPVNFPEVETFTTSNDLPVYVVPNHEVPIVSAQIVLKAGTMDDEFVADFTAQMLGEGTKRKSKAKIDEAIEFVGGSLGTGSGIHSTTMGGRVLKKDLELLLGLMSEELTQPAFPKDALEKLKKQAKTALESAKAQPAALADTLFGMVAYPEGHPYGRPFATPEQIDAVSLEDIQKFHSTFYKSNNAFMILSGDITKAEAEPLVAKALKRWKKVEDISTIPPNPLKKYAAGSYQAAQSLTIHVVDRPASAQAEIRVGNLALSRGHADWEKLAVANSVLGGGPTGRLFADIREEKGLTYGISSSVSTAQALGTFEIATRTKTKTTGEMMRAIFEHIQRMHETKPTQDERDTAVAKMVGSFPLELETAGSIASKVRTQLLYGLPTDYWKTYRDKVAATTVDDIQTAASKYMHRIPHVVIVGKADKVQEQVKEVFPDAAIVLYDTELKKK